NEVAGTGGPLGCADEGVVEEGEDLGAVACGAGDSAGGVAEAGEDLAADVGERAGIDDQIVVGEVEGAARDDAERTGLEEAAARAGGEVCEGAVVDREGGEVLAGVEHHLRAGSDDDFQ